MIFYISEKNTPGKVALPLQNSQQRKLFKNNFAILFKQYFWSVGLCALVLKKKCNIKSNMKIRMTYNKISVFCLPCYFFILRSCEIFQVQLNQIAKSSFFSSGVWKRWNLKEAAMVFICFGLINALSILCTKAQQNMQFELWRCLSQWSLPNFVMLEIFPEKQDNMRYQALCFICAAATAKQCLSFRWKK